MTNQNLTSALKGSLDMIENQPEDSPLTEADPDAINQFLDEVNSDLVAGMPERLSIPGRMEHLIDLYRAKALHWEQEQEVKRTKTTKRKPTADAIDIDLFN